MLDDGWFGERDDDTSSLGDWVVDQRKLPNGLDALARSIEDLGMRFGIWIEPEMVSPRSRLFTEHPDWAIGIPGRERTESRNQYALDLTRPEVIDHLFEAMSSVISSAPISYVKWDMNRAITEPWSAGLPPDRQPEFHHRYVLGLYALYDRLTRASRTCCSSRAPAVAAGSTRACWRLRRRRGRATTRTRWSGCESSGGRRSHTR